MVEKTYRFSKALQLVFVPLVAGALLCIGSLASVSRASRILMDPLITSAVEDELLMDKAVRLDGIDVWTREGIVTLSGTVDNILAKGRAERIAETIKGVRAVVNTIRVVPPLARLDWEIRNDVRDALFSDPATDSYQLKVTVENNTVTLSGSVDSWQEKELAEQVAKGVKGVMAVNNEITVDYKKKRPDSEIESEIEQRLRWDVLVDDGLIDVKVDDGEARLTGIVGSAAEKRVATADAWVIGVKSVDPAGLKVDRWVRDKDLRKDKYVLKSDREIQEAVEDVLMYDPRVNSLDVKTEVLDGRVTLRGVVDNLGAKRAAAQDARNTVGVARVKNRLKVRPEVQMSDRRIEERVRDAFLRHPYLDRYEIRVDVDNGTAYLSGAVPSYFDRAKAETVASRVKGVATVDNNLAVTAPEFPHPYDPYVDEWYGEDFDLYPYQYPYQPRFAMKSDIRIKEDIEDELWWSPFVDADDVEVSVENGFVTLAGTVQSWVEYRAAGENAFEGGAIWVSNNLVVKPE
jgi:osmotically-inducible protein OsmY